MSRIPISQLQALEAKVRHQRRVSSIASLLIALLSLVLVMVVLALVFLPGMLKEDVRFVPYATFKPEEVKPEARKIMPQQTRPPSPAAAVNRSIAADVVADVAIPVPDLETAEPEIAFGTGDDFAEGWGSGDGIGAGDIGAGKTTFFNQTVAAARVCFVIDYSQSMRGEREKLMRAELAKSVAGMPDGTDFQMIFFAGPSWVAGSAVKADNQKRKAEVESDGRTYRWAWDTKEKGWRPDGRRQDAEWIRCDASTRAEALERISSTRLEWGTDWLPPLEMAMDMKPAPQVIFFMTDGVVQGNMMELAERVGRRAKARGITLNTVAMMEPKADEPMKEMARRGGGQFTIIEKGGKVRVVPLGD